MDKSIDFGNEKIHKIIFKLAPPVMIAQLIQALYNIVDSLFIGRFDSKALTALSIIYPLQLLMIAIATGTGVGFNALISRFKGLNKNKEANDVSGMATPIAIISWALFSIITFFILPFYTNLQTSDNLIIEYSLSYGRIVCVFSIFLFLESFWAKILQADGRMKLPMVDQIIGALINIILDPLLIFTFNLGITGAALATVIGQGVSALILFKSSLRKPTNIKLYKLYLGKIYKLGLPNILMQSAYTFYIFGLNIILSGFSDAAVTTLGIYYKWQTFFFIPLGSLQTCIVPIISYNYARYEIKRCKKTLNETLLYGLILMLIGTLVFLLIPKELAMAFTSDSEVIEISNYAFRFVGISFIPMVTSLIYPVFFEAIGYIIRSSILTIVRTVICFVPLGYLFSRISLFWFWTTYPLTETITSIIGFVFYIQFIKKEENKMKSLNLVNGMEEQ
jgi:putative MATE family efflux protein